MLPRQKAHKISKYLYDVTSLYYTNNVLIDMFAEAPIAIAA